MSKQDSKTSKTPSKLWFLFATLILSVFIIIQLPVSWVLQKYMPNSPYILWSSGNLWQGSVNFQMLNPSNPNATETAINGNLTWQWKPLKILIGKFNADVDIISGKSKLKGELTLGKQSLKLSDISGRIDQKTLNSLISIELPDAPIQINNLTIDYDKESGFDDAGGQLTWVGGELGYPTSGITHKINLPAMKANLALAEGKADGNKGGQQNAIHLHLINAENKTLGNFYLDNAGMVDVSLTQRLLEHMPSYDGSAPQDTEVVSVRQPITSLGK